MRYHLQRNGFIERTIIVLVVILTTFFTTDTVLFGTNVYSTYQKIPQLCISAITLFLAFYVFARGRRIPVYHISVVILEIICVIMTMIATNDFRNGYIFRCVLVAFSFLAVELIDIKTYAKYFNQTMYILAILSLVCFSLEVVNHEIFSFAPRIYNSAGYGFQNLYFYVQSDAGFSPRNYGIYREPGVYQIFLIFALIFELYYFDKLNWKRVFVFSLAVLTTLSTTGILAYSLWMILVLVKPKSIPQKLKLLIVFGAALLIIPALIAVSGMIAEFLDAVFGKIRIRNGSYMARLASVTVNIRLWMRHPIFGGGLTAIDAKFVEESLKMYGKEIYSNTNTLLIPFATHGFFYGLLWLIALIKGTLNLGNTKPEKLFIGLILLAQCAGEDLGFSPFGNLLMMYGLLSKRDCKNDCDEVDLHEACFID